MRKNLPADSFDQIEFSIIGLGDSSYEKYNFTAKKLYKRLIQLSGRPLSDLCLCDEQHSEGIEGTYSKWISNYWKTFPQTLSDGSTNNLILKYQLKLVSNTDEPIESDTATERSPFNATVTRNERATAGDHWQNVRLIEFDCPTRRVAYEAGDVLMLRPANHVATIQKFYQLFQHLNLDQMHSSRIQIMSNFKPVALDSFSFVKTVHDLIEKCFDLNSIPRMSFFELFAQLATDELEKEKLNEFISPGGLEELFNYCHRPRRTLIEIFYDFPKTTLNVNSLELLLDLIPCMKPRAFSIASSPALHGSKIQILCAVVEYKTRLYETRKGTCSYWLSTLPENCVKIPIWIKKGSFKLDWTKPLICIGPGTGVAPFRSIINERIHKHRVEHNYLYFGCRSKMKDFFFENEWNDLERNYSNCFQLNAAFSRDQSEKVYVQDLMLQNFEQIFHLMDTLEANILIAGNSKRMPDDVIAILKKIITMASRNDTNATEEDRIQAAEVYVKQLLNKQRIQLETWS